MPPFRHRGDDTQEAAPAIKRILDGINRYRFAREPQLLAAWDRAKHVVGGSQVEAPAAVPEAPSGPAAPAGRKLVKCSRRREG